MFKELARGTTAVISYPPDNEMAIFRAEKGNKNWAMKTVLIQTFLPISSVELEGTRLGLKG